MKEGTPEAFGTGGPASLSPAATPSRVTLADLVGLHVTATGGSARAHRTQPGRLVGGIAQVDLAVEKAPESVPRDAEVTTEFDHR